MSDKPRTLKLFQNPSNDLSTSQPPSEEGSSSIHRLTLPPSLVESWIGLAETTDAIEVSFHHDLPSRWPDKLKPTTRLSIGERPSMISCHDAIESPGSRREEIQVGPTPSHLANYQQLLSEQGKKFSHKLTDPVLQLVVVPDNGFPTCATFSDMQSMLRTLTNKVRSADQQMSLDAYTFYAFYGKPVQIYVDEMTLAVVVELDGKRHRLKSPKLDDMTLMADGRMPGGPEVSSQAPVDDAWGEGGFEF